MNMNFLVVEVAAAGVSVLGASVLGGAVGTSSSIVAGARNASGAGYGAGDSTVASGRTMGVASNRSANAVCHSSLIFFFFLFLKTGVGMLVQVWFHDDKTGCNCLPILHDFFSKGVSIGTIQIGCWSY